MKTFSTALIALSLVVTPYLNAAPSATAAEPQSADAIRFADLKNIEIVNANGGKLGKIVDVIYAPTTGDVQYIIGSFGGFLGIGETLFAMPWQGLKHQYDAQNKRYAITVDVDRQKLAAAPRFEAHRWPDLTDPLWSSDVDKYYNYKPTARTQGARASQIVGMKVRNHRNEDLGAVEDVVFDVDRGNIRYVAVTYGGFLGLGNKLFAIPFDTLTARRDARTDRYHVVLDADRTALAKAPGFDKDQWPDFANAAWHDEVTRFYNRASIHRSLPTTTAFKSKDLVGMRVENDRREHLGKVESLAIELNTGNIHYAVLSFGGFLGIRDKHFAAPWSSFTVRYDADREAHMLVLDVDRQQLEKAPGFDARRGPDFKDSAWLKELHAFYGANAFEEGKDAMRIRDSSELVGLAIYNPQGQKLGTIDELVVDIKQGRVSYGALGFGGFLGFGEKLFAMPFQSLQLREDADKKLHGVVNVDKETLEKAPSFDARHWPDLSAPQWSEEIDRYYLRRETSG